MNEENRNLESNLLAEVELAEQPNTLLIIDMGIWMRKLVTRSEVFNPK